MMLQETPMTVSSDNTSSNNNNNNNHDEKSAMSSSGSSGSSNTPAPAAATPAATATLEKEAGKPLSVTTSTTRSQLFAATSAATGTSTTTTPAITAVAVTTISNSNNNSIGAKKNVETRRHELNELWSKLSQSTSEQRRAEEEKKQEDDDNINNNTSANANANGETQNSTVENRSQEDDAAAIVPTARDAVPAEAVQVQEAEEEEETIPVDDPPRHTRSVGEEKKQESHLMDGTTSIHIDIEEHQHHHVVQVENEESVVLVDCLAHESIALNSMRGGSIALSSTRLQQERTTNISPPSTMVAATAVAAPQQQQQKQRQQLKRHPNQAQQPQQQKQLKAQDYLRHSAAPNTTGGPKKAGTSWWERVVVQRSSYVVEDLVDQYTADSVFLQSPALPVAFLDRIELETSQLLGTGTYSNVYRVQQLQLLPDYLTDHPQQDELRKAFTEASHLPLVQDHEQYHHQQQQQQQPHRSITLSSSSADNSTGYAIKHLKSELLQNSKLFEAAAADLIMEAKFLSRMDHPNILKLRGMALGGTSTFAATGLFDSYFLVIDELQETLIQRIHRWKVQGSTNQYRPAMVLEKLKLAVQVASALTYLHERRLVFRDLKPHNIGLKKLPHLSQQQLLRQQQQQHQQQQQQHQRSIDTTSSHGSTQSQFNDRNSDGDSNIIQLFDFGFCRELPAATPGGEEPQKLPTMIGGEDNGGSGAEDGMEDVTLDSPTDRKDTTKKAAMDEDQVFCMSGKGTLLYMAAEVLSSRRCYNQKADVYSWSMVTYELLTLQKPFAVGSIEQHRKAVCERCERPPMGHLRWLTPSVKDLLEYSWEADVNTRWHMRDVEDTLHTIIIDLERRKLSSKDGSFGSFGYGKSGNKANGKEAPSYMCQGMEMDEIYVDFTNAVQNRYESVASYLFCKTDTTDVTTASTVGVADSVAAVAGKSMEPAISVEGGTNGVTASEQREISLKSYMNVTEEKSIRFDIPEKHGGDGAPEDKKDGRNTRKVDKPVSTDPQSKLQKRKEGFYMTAQKSISKAVWNGFARPHMPRTMRPPTTAPSATEQDFSERSLSMHSVRLQAAQNRRPTAWVTPSRLTSSTQSHNHAPSYGRSRPFASRSLRAHSTTLDATIELEDEEEDDEADKEDMFENSLLLPSIKLTGEHDHLEEITEETGSSLRSTGTSSVRNGQSSSLRSTSTLVTRSTNLAMEGEGYSSRASSLRSVSTPVPAYTCEGTLFEEGVAIEPPAMALDPNTDTFFGGGDDGEAELETGFGSLALSSTRIKAPKVIKEEQEEGTEDNRDDKPFIVATASV